MKKLICLILSLCIFTSLAFAEPTKNFIVERNYRLWLLVPSVITAFSSCYFAMNPIVTIDESGIYLETALGTTPLGEKSYDYTPAVILGFVSLFLVLVTVTPKKTYWKPKIDENGAIHLERQIRF